MADVLCVDVVAICRCLVVEPWQVLRLCPAQARRYGFSLHEFMVVFVENYLWGMVLNLFIEVLH